MNMNRKNKWIALFTMTLVIVIALSACKPVGEATPSAEEVAQRVAFTQQAIATQAYVDTLVAQVEALLNQPTWTPMPTYTPYPTPVMTENASETEVGQTTTEPAAPTQKSGAQCYQMEYLGDINYPPDSVVAAGKTFTKIWKVRNIGTCTWTVDFDIVRVGGDRMGGNGDLTREIAPGETVQLSVPVKAPSSSGTYWGYWMLQSTDGYRFGYGNDYSLALKIIVK